jgi:hypothetical protein
MQQTVGSVIMTQTRAGAKWKVRAGLPARQRPDAPSGLFQGRVDRRELGVQPGAKAVYDRNDGERDTCCYQAILDGGGGSFVAQESLDGSHRLARSTMTFWNEKRGDSSGVLTVVLNKIS